MDRRRLLQIVVASIPSLPSIWSWLLGPRRSAAATRSVSRVRVADPEWPPEASWDRLSQQIRGKLLKVQSPLAECIEAPSSEPERATARQHADAIDKAMNEVRKLLASISS